MLKILRIERVILIMTVTINFTKFYKGYDEFEEMSLDSKYNSIKEFSKLLIKFKALWRKISKTQLRKERIMENVDKLYEKPYKNDYDNDDELTEAKKKEFGFKQSEFFDETDEESKLDKKNKKFY